MVAAGRLGGAERGGLAREAQLSSSSSSTRAWPGPIRPSCSAAARDTSSTRPIAASSLSRHIGSRPGSRTPSRLARRQ